jgi:hypothetical protein
MAVRNRANLAANRAALIERIGSLLASSAGSLLSMALPRKPNPIATTPRSNRLVCCARRGLASRQFSVCGRCDGGSVGLQRWVRNRRSPGTTEVGLRALSTQSRSLRGMAKTTRIVRRDRQRLRTTRVSARRCSGGAPDRQTRIRRHSNFCASEYDDLCRSSYST